MGKYVLRAWRPRPPSWRRATFSLLAAALCWASLAATARAETPPAGLRAFLVSEMQRRHTPGMQVAVVRHGRIVLLESFGVANVEHAVPVTDKTVFQINSATKAFTGVAIMQLVESGKLDLSAAASRYVEGLPPAWQAITVRQLSTHMSGLPNIVDNRTGRLLVDSNDPEAIWAAVKTRPMEFSPGERTSYNQTNSLILGKIIDKVGGVPFAQFVQARQLDAVGMPLTTYGDDRDVIPNAATTYTYVLAGDGTPTDRLYKPHVEFPAPLRTAAGLNTTAQELARWLIALQGGKLLAGPSLQALWTPGLSNDGRPGEWAIGWPVIARPKHRMFMPSGGGKAAFAVYPDDDLAVVILTNLSWDMPPQMMDAVAAYYLQDLKAGGGD